MVLSTENIIVNLSHLGLNKYESRVYLTLIEEGLSTAKNVSDVTSIPYGKVYEVLNSLAQKGFIITSPTKPIKCKAVDPMEVLKTSRQSYLEKYESIQRCVESELMPAFLKNKNFLDSKTHFWTINGRSNVNKKIEELLGRAEGAINISTSTNGFKRLTIFKEALLKAHERGVPINIAAPLDSDCESDRESLSFCTVKPSKAGTGSLFVVDGSESLLVEPVPDDENIFYGRDLGILIKSSAFSELMLNSFAYSFGIPLLTH